MYLEDLNLEYSYLDVELNTDSGRTKGFMKLENKFPNHIGEKQEETPQIGLKKWIKSYYDIKRR
jgi:hypothetical protein